MNSYYNLAYVTRGIQILATHPGTIKERLTAAFHGALCYVVPARLPGPAVSIWEGVWNAATAVPADDKEGVFRLSIEALDDAEAIQLALDILRVEPLVRVATASYAGPETVN